MILDAFVCFAAALITPRSFLFEGVAYFSSFPIDKTKCPEIAPNRDVIFELYTNYNPNIPQILLLGDDGSIQNSNFDFNRPTVFFFHGFLEVNEFGSPDAIRRAYLDRGGFNIILVNAKVLLAGPWYITASKNTKAIGKYTAAFIDYLVGKGMNLRSVHLIGHSLGSHSAGICGSYVRSGRIPRITGLDPALPLFWSVPSEDKLDRFDAEFVDIIHTNGGVFGIDEPIGHVDFYPNNGKAIQPGCNIWQILKRSTTPILEITFCSHWRSFFYYAESVRNPNAFYSISFDNNENSFPTNMGLATSHNARGNYYLKTNAEPPYSM